LKRPYPTTILSKAGARTRGRCVDGEEVLAFDMTKKKQINRH
jgi:hypothetical protein